MRFIQYYQGFHAFLFVNMADRSNALPARNLRTDVCVRSSLDVVKLLSFRISVVRFHSLTSLKDAIQFGQMKS